MQVETELLNPQELRLTKKVTEETSKLLELEVTDAESYKAVAELAKVFKAGEKAVIEEFADMKQKAHDLHRTICGKEKKFADKYREAYKTASSMLDAYDRKQEEERKRLEAEIQAAEKKRQDDLALAMAEAHMGANGQESALQMLEESLNQPALPVTVQSTVPQVLGMYMRAAGYDIEIVDASKIRDEYWCPDMDAIRALVKAKGPLAENLIGKGSIRIRPKQTRVVKG